MTAPADRAALVEVIESAVSPSFGRTIHNVDGEDILTAMETVGVVPMPMEATEEMIDAADQDFPQFTGGDIRMAYLAIAIEQALAASPYKPGDGG